MGVSNVARCAGDTGVCTARCAGGLGIVIPTFSTFSEWGMWVCRMSRELLLLLRRWMMRQSWEMMMMMMMVMTMKSGLSKNLEGDRARLSKV